MKHELNHELIPHPVTDMCIIYSYHLFLVSCTVNLIQKLLKEDPDAGFLDIGANIGIYSISIAKIGRKVTGFNSGQIQNLPPEGGGGLTL